jgi:hypothetical protein
LVIIIWFNGLPNNTLFDKAIDALVTVYDGVLVKGIVECVEEDRLEDAILGIAVCTEYEPLFVKGTVECVEENTLEDTRFAKVNDDGDAVCA